MIKHQNGIKSDEKSEKSLVFAEVWNEKHNTNAI